MSTFYLVNAFSLNMLDKSNITDLRVSPIEKHEVIDLLSIESGEVSIVHAIGHQSTADLLTNILKMEIKCNRSNVTLQSDDIIIVAQYIGPRLEEGTTILPEGAKIEFYSIKAI